MTLAPEKSNDLNLRDQHLRIARRNARKNGKDRLRLRWSSIEPTSTEQGLSATSGQLMAGTECLVRLTREQRKLDA